MGWWEEAKKLGNAVGTAATGGSWSPDGHSGYMQGGAGMVSIYDQYTNNGLSKVVPGLGDAEAARIQNEENKKEAQINRDFQERMSSTAYQRAMEDMKKSGLNPMLAYMQGGASAPSGSQALINSESKTALGHFAANNLMNIATAKQQQQQVNQQALVNDSTIKLQSTAAAKNMQEAEKTRLDNVKQKKFEPLNAKAADITNSVSRTYDKIMDSLSNTARKVGEFHTPPIVQGRNVKVLGPTKNPHTYNKQKPN